MDNILNYGQYLYKDQGEGEETIKLVILTQQFPLRWLNDAWTVYRSAVTRYHLL